MSQSGLKDRVGGELEDMSLDDIIRTAYEAKMKEALNRERAKEHQKKTKEEKAEVIKERSKRYYENNKEKIKEKNKARYYTNKLKREKASQDKKD